MPSAATLKEIIMDGSDFRYNYDNCEKMMDLNHHPDIIFLFRKYCNDFERVSIANTKFEFHATFSSKTHRLNLFEKAPRALKRFRK